MPTRRTFLQSAAALALLPATTHAQPAPASAPASAASQSDRAYWLAITEKLARPVLKNLAANTLRKTMPVESSGKNRDQYTHLEALARLLAGIAPWLASTPTDPAEKVLHKDLLALTQKALDNATNPDAPDFLNYKNGGQALVDTAFLAQALLRGKSALYDSLPQKIQQQLVAALKASRAIPAPDRNNWVLFASTIEAALLELGETPQAPRLHTELQRQLSWYKGDGVYGDGEPFHFDYYNSYVIHPMLLDGTSTLARHDPRFEKPAAAALRRAQRYAQIQERLIAPDGSFPVVGRSITYRMGAFHLLAAIALQQQLPPELPPAQVRTALTASIKKCMDAPDTFDPNGFLRIGLAGHQPALAEDYISTGSLYLCSTALLPLGLPPTDPFWSGPATPFTSQQAWSGHNLPRDHALDDPRPIALPEPA
jgi:hypothetical protein